MAAVQPIKSKSTLKLAAQWIKSQQISYQAIYHIGISCGIRTTDITELQWDNIDLEKGLVTVNENKGTRANKARARLKVLDAVKNELIALNADDTKKMLKIFVTKPKDIYELIPDNLRASIDVRIEQAMAKAKVKSRTAKLSPKALTALRKLKNNNAKIDAGFIFSRNTFLSNRAKNSDGVISRQSVYRLYKNLEKHLLSIGEKVGKLGGHSGRKTAAFALYKASGHNIALVMGAMGWSSEILVLKYLCIDNNEQMDAFDLAHKGM